jgi:hypothetical protein
MSHRILFYPVGNGDTSQIVLENGKRILFDFRHLSSSEDGKGPEINLSERLKQELKEAERSSFDVVAFTHGDKDHIENSTDFFELRHSSKYQGSDRIKIDTLWVPAAMILESASKEERSSEFVIWRQEARYRLKEGNGIRVFSKPERLKEWLEENDLSIESRQGLITDAGAIAPEFSFGNDGVEFFCHSPFMRHVDEREEFRNEASLIFNVRFEISGNTYDYFAVGDTEYGVLEEVVAATKRHKRMDRLSWDLFSVPHHCSYKALSDEKGTTETAPVPLVKEILLQGKQGAYIVSSSEPTQDTEEARLQEQPPHIQARKCYERFLEQVDGARLLVTMEESKASEPKPIVFQLDRDGLTHEKPRLSAATHITSRPAPRAG